MRSVSRSVLFAALAGLACALVPAAAHAGQACTVAADCQKGYACQVVGGTACPGIACMDGADCGTLPPCTPTEIRECVPGGTCAVDADCGANMVCHESPMANCSTPAVACAKPVDGGAIDCPTVAPSCTTTTTKSCTFKWSLPCTAASDCGSATDFECIDQNVCSISVPPAGTGTGSATAGSGTTGSTPGTSASAPTPTDPTTAPTPVPVDAGIAFQVPPADVSDAAPVCTPTGVKYCHALPKTCTTTAQCPADWTCQTSTIDVGCPAIAFADGATLPCNTTASNPSGQCVPPGSWAYDVTTGRSPSVDTGNTTPPSVLTAGDGATPAPSSGATTGNGAAATPAADDVSGGGCSVSSGRTSGSAALLLALGAIFALGRRRRAI